MIPMFAKLFVLFIKYRSFASAWENIDSEVRLWLDF